MARWTVRAPENDLAPRGVTQSQPRTRWLGTTDRSSADGCRADGGRNGSEYVCLAGKHVRLALRDFSAVVAL